MRRWICPRCGSGVNAPERPRADDARRYCLKCSADTGRLVQRTSPALERKREVAAEATRERQRVKRQRKREAKLVLTHDAAGTEHKLDVEAIVRRALREMSYRGRTPEVVVRRRTDGLYSGHAWPTAWPPRITVSLSGHTEDDLVLIYHEAAHIAAGYDATDRRRWHGERFQRILADALQGRWPFLRYGSLRTQERYDGGRAARAQLREHVRAGGDL